MSELRTNRIVPRDGLPSGASGGIVQIVQASDDTHVTTSSITPTAIVSATITPTLASNKILIQYTAAASFDGGASHANTCILRGSTKIAAADSGTGSGEAFRANKTLYEDNGSQDGNNMNSLSGSFLDSPATTDSITYAVGGFSNSSSYSCAFNRRLSSTTYGQVSEIILMEITG
jgi:hypothetical protein